MMWGRSMVLGAGRLHACWVAGRSYVAHGGEALHMTRVNRRAAARGRRLDPGVGG